MLNRFDGDEWSSGNRDVPTEQRRRRRPCPPLPGLDRTVARKEYDYDVEASTSFESTLAADAVPDPRSRPPATGATTDDTMDFLAGDDDRHRGPRPTVTARRPRA